MMAQRFFCFFIFLHSALERKKEPSRLPMITCNHRDIHLANIGFWQAEKNMDYSAMHFEGPFSDIAQAAADLKCHVAPC
jgi:hypothetical protein